MTPLLVAFLLAAGAPLLVATWRTSLLGLALQGALLAAMALERGWPTTAAAAALLADLLLLRTWFAPRLLHRIVVIVLTLVGALTILYGLAPGAFPSLG